MRGIWMLVRRDVARATSNTMAIIVVVGLSVLPSLFTWFNVIASWDPFANVDELTVAVANTDEGYQSDLIPVRLNIGDQVVSDLRANEDFHWVVTTEEDAVDGTKSGEYYAAIVLPPEFSKDMLTFYAPGATRTDITYYTNEKKNALAPKITGQGADRVSAGINRVFSQTLSEIGVNILSSLSDHLSSDQTKVLLARLESHVGQTSAQLRSAATTADTFSTLIASSRTLLGSSTRLVEATGQTLDDATGAIGSGLDAAGSLKSTLDSATAGVSAALEVSSQGWADLADKVDAVFAAADQQTTDGVDVLNGMSEQVQAQIDAYEGLRTRLEQDVAPNLPDGALDPALDALDLAISHQEDVQDALDQAAGKLSSENSGAQATHRELARTIAEAKAAVDKLHDVYDTDLRGQLDQLGVALAAARSAAGDVGTDLDRAASGLTGASDSLAVQLAHAQTVTTSVSTDLDAAAETFDRLGTALAEAADTGDLSALQGVLGEDPSSVAASLAAPVGLNRVAVFPVANFGSAMAPLYTMLALWVGALLMSVSIQVGVHRDTLPDGPDLAPHQKYLGRYGIFGLIGFVQSTLVCLGNLVFVQVQSVHPLLYMLTGWMTSLVFTLTVYTAVVAFGNAGKALCVLLLVVQISTSGGAYPLQLLPEWFQRISIFLPATYSVRAFTAAIAGIYHADYWHSIGTLALFILPALLLGLVVRKPLISFNRNLAAALESTKLM
ncbi:YhgE/Pip domain-containing protein [Actinomyces polynesiensis]|uniref:YhgE/Pip domain-containing protein n=1 Tax=Actinomyces polynesiensis TaxID=1325934 RepID=UPI0005BAA379|nr:YhgE/Pip domain-containing protein [Actinomyces polynesiensis]